MSRLADVISKVGMSQDDVVELMEYIRKHGSEKAGIQAYIEDANKTLEEIHIQLKAQGVETEDDEEGPTDTDLDE